jgi:hypothetical protein
MKVRKLKKQETRALMPIRGDGFHRTIAVGATAVVTAVMMMLAATPGLAETIGGWGDAELIETEDGSVGWPQVAMDGDGNAIAVWEQSDGTQQSIWSNRYAVGTGWGDAQLIEDRGGNANFPQVAMDAEGNAIAVWRQLDGTEYSIWSNRYVAGVGWGEPDLIEADYGFATNPQVAMDVNGNAVAVWEQFDYYAFEFSIYSNRYVVGVGWGDAELVEPYTGDAYSPQVAMDADGNAVAVWRQFDGTKWNIWSNRYVAGVGWDNAQLIDTDDTGDDYGPQVAVDGSGDATAVWYQMDETRSTIKSSRYVVGAGWGDAGLIGTESGHAYAPQVALDADGNVIAVWQQSDGVTAYDLWSNRYVVGIGWGDAQVIETEYGDVYSQQVAMGGDGNAIAVWHQFDGTQYSIYSNQYVVGVGWGDSELIEAEEGNALSPQVAMDAEGNAIAVWEQYDGTQSSIWSNRFTSLDTHHQHRHCTGTTDAAVL